jgi:hypothetical protein
LTQRDQIAVPQLFPWELQAIRPIGAKIVVKTVVKRPQLFTTIADFQNECAEIEFGNAGAGNGARTRDLNFGKVALCRLSYPRGVWEYSVRRLDVGQAGAGGVDENLCPRGGIGLIFEAVQDGGLGAELEERVVGFGSLLE